MRGMKRNKRPFWYALCIGHEIVRENGDPNGYEIGRKAIYSDPVKAYANISAGGGEIGSSRVGILTDYNKVLNPLPVDFPMDEESLIWIDREPKRLEDGTFDPQPNYTVRHVSTTPETKSYALMQNGG